MSHEFRWPSALLGASLYMLCHLVAPDKADAAHALAAIGQALGLALMAIPAFLLLVRVGCRRTEQESPKGLLPAPAPKHN